MHTLNSQLQKSRTILFAVSISLWAATDPVLSQQPPGPSHESSESSQSQDPEPVATERDTVLVEARLPYVPTSNTIATKLPIELEWTPANVGIVSSPLLREQNSLILGDALQNISGVNVQTGSGIFDFFVVRGFDSLSSALILTDGAPELETTFYQMYNAERVELLKGPGGFLYGPNPLAGSVNIVRKQPVASNLGELSVMGASFNTLEGAFDLNRANNDGSLSFRLNGLYRETDGYRDDREGEVGAINPAFTWRPDQNSSLNFNFEYLGSDYHPDAGIPLVGGELPDVPRTRSYASPFDRSEQDLSRFQIDYERHISDTLTLRNKTYYRGLDWLSDGTLLGFVLPTIDGSLQVTRSLILLDDKQDILGNQLEALWTVETGSITHRLLFGLELSRYQDDFSLDVGLLAPIDIFRPVEPGLDPIPLPSQSASGDSQSDVIAPYVIDEISLTSSFRLLIGARYDDIDFKDDVSQTSRSDGEVSPILGAVFRATENFSLYGNLTRSFAPPSPRITGERKPEESNEVEVGIRQHLLDRRLRLTLAAFQLDRQNIAIPDDNGFTQQVGDQESKGVELEVLIETQAGLRGVFSYAYTDSELTRFTEQVLISLFPPTFATVDRSGNKAAFAPEHLSRLWLSKDVIGRLTLGGGLRYVGEQFISEDNAVELDDYWLVDLALIYPWQKWQFSLHLNNVTDQDFETRGFGGASVIPGDPFSAAATLKYRF